MAKFKTTVGFTVTRQDSTTGTKTIGGLNTAPPMPFQATETMDYGDDARGMSAKNFAVTIVQLVTSVLTSDSYVPSYYQERRQFADIPA